jgi:hypothetical protein
VAAIRAKYRDRADIVFSALPTDRHTGSLINFGVRHSSGDYFFKIDDDDHYGANYIYDCMLHLRARDVGIFGKRGSLLHFEGDNFVHLRKDMPMQIAHFSAKDLGANGRPMLSNAGFACKSNVIKEIAYPDDINLSADTEFLNRLQTAQPNTQCLTVDSLNFVIERSTDIEKHTWRRAAAALKRDSQMLDKTIADLMV